MQRIHRIIACIDTPNPGQEDTNQDGVGDACEQESQQNAPVCSINTLQKLTD